MSLLPYASSLHRARVCRQVRSRRVWFATLSSVLIATAWIALPSIASAQRFPFVIPGDDAKDTVTSRAVLLEKPAGKNGFVSAREGHFFVGGDRIRFWGVNLCFGSNFPSHSDADRIAPHLAKLGVNAVRFHHMDSQNAPSGIWSPQLQNGQRVFDPEMVDRLDYFLARLHENGIYADLNLHCSRELSRAEGFPRLDGAPWWAGANKWVMYYDPSVQDAVKRYSRDLLSHRNPYRDNLRRADDPGIALVEMLNENYFSKQGYSLYRSLPQRFQQSLIMAWNQWLIEKYGNTAEMKAQWQKRQPSLEADLVDSSVFNRSLGRWGLSRDAATLPRQLNVAPPPSAPDTPALRVEPIEVSENDYQQQLRHDGLSTVAGKPYTLVYWVRSDRPRTYRAELSTSQGGEWRDLGIFESLEATPQWQQVTRILFPKETVRDDVALRFNFGNSTVPIEFAGISFRPGAIARSLDGDQNLESHSVAIPDALSPVAAHADMQQFMIDTEVAWVEEFKSFLVDDLGVKVPVMASQVNYHTPEVNERLNDFVDVHNYWHHPMFPADAQWDSQRWTVGNDPIEADPTRSSWPTNSLLMRTAWRHAGKPMTMTEWNYPEPSYYSSGCVPIAAALAALQDWDAVFFFEYDSGSTETATWMRDHTINYFSFNGQPVKLANLSVFANVFLRGDLAPLRRERLGPIDAPIDGTHAFEYRLGVSPAVKQAEPIESVDPSNLSTSDGSLRWISDQGKSGHVLIDTPRTQGVWGTIADQSFETAELSMQVAALAPNYGTLVATSQSDAPISKSKQILLLASTHSENTGMRWNADRTSVGRNWGTGPTTVLGMQAVVTLKSEVAGRVFALDGQGQRVKEIDAERKDDSIVFEISPEDETIWYDITVSKPPPKPFQWVNAIPEDHPPELRHATFPSKIVGQDVGYAILLPDDYDSTSKRYPVVYYLHGGRPGSEAKSVRLADHFVRLRREHQLDQVIYVFVNGGPVSHYNVPDQIGVEGKPDALGADVFIKELIPYIDANYRTIATRQGRGLEGFSQGGRGTMRLSLRYPELFSSVAAGGGGYATEKIISESPDSAESETLRFAKGDNTWDLARAYAGRADAPKLNLMIYVGTKGFNYENNLQYMEFLKEQGIDHQALIVPEVPHSATGIYEKSGLEIMRFHEANLSQR